MNNKQLPQYKIPLFLVLWQQLQSTQQQRKIFPMCIQILELCLKYI